ncbi:MAG: SpoIIE family protein phosphatase [Phycisphaera sp.]|nr:SpoIIE family protein phosphatase [Phycisphaera sp.]
MTQPSNHLTDFIPPRTLQQVANSFAAVTGFPAAILDANGKLLAQSRDDDRNIAQARTVRQKLGAQDKGGRPLTVSIKLGGERIGTMALLRSSKKFKGVGERSRRRGDPGFEPQPYLDAGQFLHLLAYTIGEVCRQGVQLQHRVEELSTLFQLSKLLADTRELRRVLETVTMSLVELLNVKAAAIRMLDDSGEKLVIASVHNLSRQFQAKGFIPLSKSEIDRLALEGEVVYVADMTNDPRVLFPHDAKREGLQSMLCAGMSYRGKPIGTMRIFSETMQTFSVNKKNLLRAIAQLAAATIRNAQLDAERQENIRIQRQVQLAADVQRQLLPQSVPHYPPFEVAGRYESCFELGGDFYDFIPMEDELGVVVGDVVGKGVAAGLLMASVRASLRAHVEDVADIARVMARVNAALTRDSRDNEFATVFYATLDPRTMTLTYSSAGHDPALLLHNGRITELESGGLPLGIDANEFYEKQSFDLEAGDVLLMYTDGVTDASDFEGQKFGRDRIKEALLECGHQSAHHIVNHVLWQVRRFAGLNRRPDDITIVAVKVNDLDRATGKMVAATASLGNLEQVKDMLSDSTGDSTVIVPPSSGGSRSVSDPNDATVVLDSAGDSEEGEEFLEQLVQDERGKTFDPALSGHLSPEAHLEFEQAAQEQAEAERAAGDLAGGLDATEQDDGFDDDLGTVDDDEHL